MIRGLTGRAALVAAIARRDVDLAAEDRVDAALPRRIVKDDGREHVAVLGDGQGRHLELLRLIEQLVDAARTIQQRELCVKVQMDELRHAIPTASLPSLRSGSHSHSIVEGGFELMS